MSDDSNSKPSPLNLAQTDVLKGVVAVSSLYLGSTVYVAPFLSKENGLSQRFLLPIWLRVFSALRFGQPSKGKTSIALLMAGAAVTFIFTAMGSVTANAASNRLGYNNKEPRVRKAQMKGLYGRIASAHDNLLEFFPAFAAAAILAAQYDTRGAMFDNQLALVATLKYLIFPTAYYLDLDILRTLSHVISVGGVVNLFARIAFV